MFRKKLMNIFGLFMLIMALFSASALAVDPANDIVKYIEINDNKVEDGDKLEVVLGDTLDITVKVEGPAEDVLIETALVYEYGQYDDSVRDQTRTFNVDEETVSYKDLSVEVPIRMARADEALLHVFVYSASREAYTYTFPLNIEGVDREDAVMITEAYLSPDTVMAGRGTKATIKVKNYGDKDLDDVTLIARIPALSLQDVETLDELESGEKETFENLVLRIPCDAQPGVYDVIYTLKFDEYESTTTTDSLTVIESVDCGASTSNDDDEVKTVITVPDSQMLTAGDVGVAYPVVISNTGNEAKSYQLTIQGVESWGTARMDPSANIIVDAGQTSTAFLYVTANDNAQAGEKVFQLTINDGSEAKQIPLKANIVADSNDWSGLKKVLEVGLIVLVIILIVIGLIVGFNKLRGDDDEDDDDKTYY